MSSIYASEPPTCGKVILTTSHGDIDIELFSKEATRTCRNFIQLCLDGYYDSNIWHRIVKDLLIQTGGGRTGSSGGSFGDDIFGGSEDFASGREIHSRLRFSHRGQVAMGGPRGSQFFISLAPCTWLTGKHAIFGKVTGDTIFTVMRLAELQVDANDRPIAEDDNSAPRILRVNVISNPFPDLIPRLPSHPISSTSTTTTTTAAAATLPKTSKKSALSFIIDDDDDNDEDGGGGGGGGGGASVGARASGQRRGVLSIHEAAIPRVPTVNPSSSLTLSRAAAAAREALDELQSSGDEETAAVIFTTSSRMEGDDDSGRGPARLPAPTVMPSLLLNNQPSSVPAPGAREFAQLVAKIKGPATLLLPTTTAVQPTATGTTSATTATTGTAPPPISALAAMRASYDAKKLTSVPRGRAGEAAMLSRLAIFQEKLASAKNTTTHAAASTTSTSYTGAASYHGQILEKDDDGDDDTFDKDGVAWATGKLSFVKHVDDASRGVLGVKRQRWRGEGDKDEI